MRRLLLLITILLCSTLSAQAGLLIEPVVGYNVITKFEGESGGRGMTYGGRLGYQNLGFQLGLDYLNSTIALDVDETDDDFKTTEFGGFVGYQFPIFLRVYAGYVFSAKSEEIKFEDPDGGLDDTLAFTEGSGPKFGIGFTPFPFVALNFEMRSIKYETIEGEDGDTGAKIDEALDIKTTAYMVSLSIPIDI